MFTWIEHNGSATTRPLTHTHNEVGCIRAVIRPILVHIHIARSVAEPPTTGADSAIVHGHALVGQADLCDIGGLKVADEASQVVFDIDFRRRLAESRRALA